MQKVESNSQVTYQPITPSDNASFNPEDRDQVRNVFKFDVRKKWNSSKSENSKVEIYSKFINYCLIQLQDNFIRKKY